METNVKDTNYKFIQTIRAKNLINWSVQYLIGVSFSYNENFDLLRIGDFLQRNKTPIQIENNEEYKRVTIKMNNGGVFLRDKTKGQNIGTKKQFQISEGQFLLSKIDARNGAFGVVPQEVDNAVITGNFWTFDVDYSKINPHFLSLITTTPEFIKFCEQSSNGTTNRHYLQENLFLDVQIPLPSIPEQDKLVKQFNKLNQLAESQEAQADELEKGIDEYLFKELGTFFPEKKEKSTFLDFISFKDIIEWGIDKIKGEYVLKSTKFEIVSFAENTNLYCEVFRGKSPKYKHNSTEIILNQKCNRWNKIELEHAKTVNEIWYNSISDKNFTKENDIIINSTGDGTIGRATKITSEYENLIYDSHILLLRLNLKLVNPLFFTYFFNSKFGQIQIEKIKSAQSTKQTELGVENLKKIQFPLPKPEKQQEISEQIQSWKTEIKTLREQAKANRANAIKEFENEIFEKQTT